MYVTEHARGRLVARMGEDTAARLVGIFESWEGKPGVIAYIAGTLYVDAVAGVRGTHVIVAVAQDGSVETVYFRRMGQDLSAAYFGASEVVNMPAVYAGKGGRR